MIGVMLIGVRGQELRLAVMRHLHPNEGDEASRVALFLGVPARDVAVYPLITIDEDGRNWMGARAFSAHGELSQVLNKLLGNDIIPRITMDDDMRNVTVGPTDHVLEFDRRLREAREALRTTADIAEKAIAEIIQLRARIKELEASG